MAMEEKEEEDTTQEVMRPPRGCWHPQKKAGGGREGGGIPQAEVLVSLAEPRPRCTCLKEASAKKGKWLLWTFHPKKEGEGIPLLLPSSYPTSPIRSSH